MFKRILVSFVVAVLAAAGAGQAAALPTPVPAARSQYVAVIVWHDVVPAKEVWFDTTLDTFRSQLEAIRRGGFHVVTLHALLRHLQTGAPLPSKALVLTFDDDGHGIYENAFPLLEQYHFPATMFVHTNYVGLNTHHKRHNTWAQIERMARSGLMTVQSQTANHPPNLPDLSDADVRHECVLSRFSLQYHLGRAYPIYAIAYPYDNYDARVERLAAKYGYSLGFTEDWGNADASANLLEIHRYSALTRFPQALHDVAAAAAR